MDLLHYIYPQHYLRSAWSTYFPHHLRLNTQPTPHISISTCIAYTSIFTLALPPCCINALYYIFGPPYLHYTHTAYSPHCLRSTCIIHTSLLFILLPCYMTILHYFYSTLLTPFYINNLLSTLSLFYMRNLYLIINPCITALLNGHLTLYLPSTLPSFGMDDLISIFSILHKQPTTHYLHFYMDSLHLDI